jgi:hypothetical protein
MSLISTVIQYRNHLYQLPQYLEHDKALILKYYFNNIAHTSDYVQYIRYNNNNYMQFPG